MKKLNLFLVVFITSIFSFSAIAQHEVIGKVVDKNGEELAGASIRLKGTQKGVLANGKGMYKITVPNAKKSVLVFSFLGMKTKQVVVNRRKIINVTLKPENVALNEVVAIGYGNVRRKDITGSVASVDMQELKKVPVANITDALKGRIAGVNITSSEGSPDASVNIRIRGGMSITQSNEPLYIIDGFPSESSDFSALNSSDIESINVLKDASSTAIYGSRGANGVVVVTTKTGKIGKVNISYEGYYGIKQLSKRLDVLSTPDFVYLDYERRNNEKSALNKFKKMYGDFSNIEKEYANRGVNWQDEVFRKANSTSHKVNISGGVKGIKYSASYNHQNDEGVMMESGMRKDNLRFKLYHKLNKRLRFNLRANYTDMKTYGMGTSEGAGSFGKINHIIMYMPTLGVLAPDSQLRTDPEVNNLIKDDDGNTMQNPAISAQYEKKEKQLRIFSGGGSLEAIILKGLKFKSTNGILYRSQRNDYFNGSQSINAKRTSINGGIKYYELGRFSTSNVLTYSLRRNKHRLNLMAGQEYIKTWRRSVDLSVTNFPNDDIGLDDISLGLPGKLNSNFNDDDILSSFFTRVNYNLSDKYILTGTLRADGSSKFGSNNKWGIFPAAAFAWRMIDEPFIKKLGWFSDLKLKVGYGSAGNNNIPNYQSLDVWGSVNTPYLEGFVPGIVLGQLPNDNLIWESNNTFNVGLDFGLFNDRIVVSSEFYVNRSNDLLLKAKMPLSSGYKYMYRNVGSTQNMGVDLSINTVNIEKRRFKWTSTLTLSHNKNEILSLAGEDSYLETSNWGYKQSDYLVAVGKSIGLMYGFKTLGLYQTDDFVTETDATGKKVFKMNSKGKYILKDGVVKRANVDVEPGFWKFEDVHDTKEGIVDDNDRQVIGDANPIFYGGLNNTFVYKHFDLSIFMNFSYGNDILNATKLYTSLFGWSNKNTLASNDAEHRWITIGNDGNPITGVDELTQLNKGKEVAQWDDMENGDQNIHSWGVEDGSFLRIANITLGYNYPRKRLKKLMIKGLRFYASANNLYTFTKYSGFDPEVSTRNSSGTTPGVDWGAYPRSTSLIFGLKVTF